jgi:hypothetical protein
MFPARRDDRRRAGMHMTKRKKETEAAELKALVERCLAAKAA